MRHVLYSLLALLALGGIAFGMDINGELKKALLEQLTSDPTGTEGRIYWDSDDNLFRFYTGAAWRTVADTTSTVVNPMDSTGDMIYGGASGAATKLDSGTAGEWLVSGGAAIPDWTNTVTTGKVIDMAADGVGLTIQGNTSYTGNTLLIENGAGTDLFVVNGNGTWSAPVGAGTLERVSVYDIDIAQNAASGIFMGVPTSAGRVAMYYATAASSATPCETHCDSFDDERNLDTASGLCLGGWNAGNGDRLGATAAASCSSVTSVAKNCLCMGATQN